MKLAVLALVSFSLFSTRAFAIDYYVDVQNGNDAAAGTSPASAWRTLTFAATTAAPGGGNSIHVAPGTYSPATGESFPLQFHGQQIIGDQGAALTIIDVGGGTHAFEVFNSPPTPQPIGVSRLKGLTIENGGGGVRLEYTWSGISLTIEDVVFRNLSTFGMSARSDTFTGSAANYHITLRRCRFQNCGTGIVVPGGASGPNSIDAFDCMFVDNSLRGLDLSVRSTLTVQLERCRITKCGLDGMRVSGVNLGFGTIALRDCLLASGTNGYSASTAFQSNVSTTFTRCTIASNSSNGITSTPAAGVLNPSFTLQSTLVWGNGVDYSASNLPLSSFSEIGGPNPLFRDTTNDDFRVYFASPVIDAGDPATPLGTLDIAGIARSVDGDLDTNERADIGCHEFRTLDIDFPGPIGTTLRLEIFGPAGGTSAVRLSRGPLVAPSATPFGEFDLNPTLNFLWFTFATAPGPGTVFARTIPPDPIFIGQTYSFQGLVTSAAAPSGAAWSNGVSLTITP